jgi:hypothetical protein
MFDQMGINRPKITLFPSSFALALLIVCSLAANAAQAQTESLLPRNRRLWL